MFPLKRSKLFARAFRGIFSTQDRSIWNPDARDRLEFLLEMETRHRFIGNVYECRGWFVKHKNITEYLKTKEEEKRNILFR